jgi:hypothetical protein
MAQPRQHIRSTQPRPSLPVPHANGDTPALPDACLTIHELPLTHLFSNDTGCFTPRARSGNQYIMVALHADSNAILVRPFASQQDTHHIAAYNDIFNRLAATRRQPTIHIMDNEASNAFQQAIANNNCALQLVPPNVHRRRNAAERAIRTFKDHFLAILAGMAPSFPADRWDLLLLHAELTLNLIRPSPTPVSAWGNLFGPYNFDATPIGPAGCRVLIHNKATLRRSWDYRCRDGFYICPAMKHYRCYQVLTKDTCTVTISDAVKFRHHNLPSPMLTTADKLLSALQCLNATLANRLDTACQDQLAAIDALRALLHVTSTHAEPHPPRNRAPLRPLQRPLRHLQGWHHRRYLQGWTRMDGPRSHDAQHDAHKHSPRPQSLREHDHEG